MMPKITLRIEVVRSSNKSLSSMGEVSARDIVTTLSRHYSDVVMTNVDTVQDLEALLARKPGLVFAGIYFVRDESRGGEKVWLTDALEQHGIAYTGSGQQANRLSLNKDLAKQRVSEHGVRTASFKLAACNDVMAISAGDLLFPLFVKPSNKNGRQGVDTFSVVHTIAQLQKKVHSIHADYKADALVEEYLSGREFTVAVLGDLDNGFIAMPFELIAAKDSNGDRIRSNILGTSDADDMLAIADSHEQLLLKTLAIDAFRALGGIGYGRIDIRFNELGEAFFLEANHIPSLNRAHSTFPKAYDITFGLNYEALIMHIAKLGIEHRATTPIRSVPSLTF